MDWNTDLICGAQHTLAGRLFQSSRREGTTVRLRIHFGRRQRLHPPRYGDASADGEFIRSRLGGGDLGGVGGALGDSEAVGSAPSSSGSSDMEDSSIPAMLVLLVVELRWRW